MNQGHDRHDRLLVTRFAVGDAYPGEVELAKELVRHCADCAALAADIRLIAARTADLPVVRRPRDFRISAAQAERLRGSWLERLLRSFSAPGWGLARPLASAALVVGLSLAVIGALPLGVASSGAADTLTVPATGQPVGAPPVAPNQQPSQIGNQTRASSPPEFETTGGASPASTGGVPAVGPLPAPTAQTRPAATLSASDSSVESPANGKHDTAAPATPEPVTAATAPAAPLPSPTQKVAVVVPPAAPSVAPQPAPATNDQIVAPAAAPSSDRTLLESIGICLALFALAILLIAWLARRRYSDPLIR